MDIQDAYNEWSKTYDYDENLGGKTFLSPTLVVIGKVVALHEKFQWLQSNPETVEYFPSDTVTQNKNEQLALTA